METNETMNVSEENSKSKSKKKKSKEKSSKQQLKSELSDSIDSSSANTGEKQQQQQQQQEKQEQPQVKLEPICGKTKTTIDPISGQQSNSVNKKAGPSKNKFCNCMPEADSQPKTFESLREEILRTQAKYCPTCHVKWKSVILIEKPISIFELLYSLEGVLVISKALLQHSILYYAAMLAYFDAQMAEDLDISNVSRYMLLGITALFVAVTSFNMVRSAISQARQLVDRADDKLIIDVLKDFTVK